jgi:hypothetical protein
MQSESRKPWSVAALFFSRGVTFQGGDIMASKQTAEHGSFSDLRQLHGDYCNVLGAFFSPEGKTRSPDNFNHHANRLLRDFACTRSVVDEVEPKLAAHHAAPVRFNQAVVSSCYVRLTRDVALNVEKIVEGYWRELHRFIPHTSMHPQYAFTSEHLAELARRFDESRVFRSSVDPKQRWSEICGWLGEMFVGLQQEAAWLDEQEAKGKPEATASKRKRGRPSTAERNEEWLVEYERDGWKQKSIAAFARHYRVDRSTMSKGLKEAEEARKNR